MTTQERELPLLTEVAKKLGYDGPYPANNRPSYSEGVLSGVPDAVAELTEENVFDVGFSYGKGLTVLRIQDGKLSVGVESETPEDAEAVGQAHREREIAYYDEMIASAATERLRAYWEQAKQDFVNPPPPPRQTVQFMFEIPGLGVMEGEAFPPNAEKFFHKPV